MMGDPVELVAFVFDGAYIARTHVSSYGENKIGYWWWPPRVDETIEVEADE